jgi:general secretion pathway protein G
MRHPYAGGHRVARRGFTLMEILIVVVIIGILAAVVVPKYSGLVSEASTSALLDQLRQTRASIELYRLQHADLPPALNGSDWTDLTQAKPNTFGVSCGPYLTSVPKNPRNNFSDVAVVNTNQNWGDPVVGVNIGFVINSNTGMIWATNTAGDMVYNEANPKDPNN